MGYNHIHICGHLGRDPEFKETQAGKPMIRFSVAVTKVYKGKENTTWFKVVGFGELAERCRRSLVKGCKLSIYGEMESRQYEHNGETRYEWSVLMRSVEFHTRPEASKRTEQVRTIRRDPVNPQVEIHDPWTWDKTFTPENDTAKNDWKWETNPVDTTSSFPWRQEDPNKFSK